MITLIILSLFGLSLILCIVLGVSVLYSLVFGLILFFSYGLIQKHSFAEMLRMSFSGILTVKNILLTFVLIGMITSLWRCCGTIPYIVYHATAFCSPRLMLPLTFLLCCLLSFLTGTSVGTAATIGVICMSIANTMGLPPMLTGGAILSGAYFGDRCSPMSTSALLVVTLTETNIYRNIRNMLKSALIPFILSCLLYFAIGFFVKTIPGGSDVRSVFARNFNMHFTVMLPALLILVLSAFRTNVRITMSISIVTAVLAAVFVQGVAPLKLLRAAFFGFHPAEPELAAMLDGGGIISMARVFAMICISSCYAGIFRGTGFLDDISLHIDHLAERITPYGCVTLTALLTGLISCSQTLSIILTHQLCGHLNPDREDFARDLENTAVMFSAMIPWSAACAMPLAAVGAPIASVLPAFYLYFVPLWSLITHLRRPESSARAFPAG